MSEKDPKYKAPGRVSSFPYTNQSGRFQVIIGAVFGAVPTTNAPGTVVEALDVLDAAGNSIDNIALGDTQEAITPTPTGTQYILQLTHRMLVPPSGRVTTPGAIVTAIQLIDCKTLEDALMIR